MNNERATLGNRGGICAGNGKIRHAQGDAPKTGNEATCPSSEYSERFWELMRNRMGMSYCKYGPVAKAFPDKVSALHSLLDRLRKYESTGNAEYMVDAANFAMIEFMRPSHKEAHFEPTDSNGSPGRRWRDKKQPTQQDNFAEVN